MENDQTKETVENTEPNEMDEARKAAMAKEMDSAEAGIRHAVQLRFFLSVVVGVPLGYAVSYLFQSEPFRAIVSFENYLRYFYDMLMPRGAVGALATGMMGNFHYVAWGGVFVVGTVFSLLGSIFVANAGNEARAVMSDAAVKDMTRWYSSRMVVFGKVKANEERFGTSIKRIFKMLFIVLSLLIGTCAILVLISAKSK